MPPLDLPPDLAYIHAMIDRQNLETAGNSSMETPDYAALKKGGFMRQVQDRMFSLRLRVSGGRLGAEQLRKIAEVADRFGRGYVHLTSRQGVEIPFIAFADIDAVKAALAEAGVAPGTLGARVRTVTACQGNAVCPNGLIETGDLANATARRYDGVELPHKFKIGITGCPNNCLKAEENDLGIKGAAVPGWQKNACTFCGACESVCPVKAITVDDKVKSLVTDMEKCVLCGKCMKSCPADARPGEWGWLLSFGGSFGKEIRSGARVLPLVSSRDDLFRAADSAIAFYREYGKSGERFGRTIARLGLDAFTTFMRGRMEA